MSETMSRRRFAKLGVVGLGTLALAGGGLALMPTSKAEAANYTVTTLPDSQGLVSDDLALTMDLSTLSSYTWGTGCSGVTSIVNGYRVFEVPRKSAATVTGWSYTNALTLVFKNVGTLEGKKLNATLTVDKISITSATWQSGSTVPSYLKIFQIPPSGLSSFNTYGTQDAGSENPFYKGEPYFYQMLFKYTIKITYASSGAVVDMPFYQRVSDLDVNQEVSQEAWEAGDGFDGQFYIYKSCYLDVNAPKFSTPSTIDPAARLDGDESITKGGVVGVTTNGQFSGTFTENECGSSIQIFSAFTSIDDPTKSYKITYN